MHGETQNFYNQGSGYDSIPYSILNVWTYRYKFQNVGLAKTFFQNPQAAKPMTFFKLRLWG